MPTTETDWDAETEALRKRLEILAAGRTKSEIARKTNTSVTNVARYLAGTRMPTEFSVALVRGLGVNPAWWLAGEGTPYVSDITSGTAAMGGNLLELVEAMNAVSQMRLGALTGKHHLRVLRELNDALTTYESLRVKLNVHSTGIFRQLLSDLSNALDRFQTDPAKELLKAAEQVARLCDDPELKKQLLAMQARFHFYMSNHARSLEYHRKLVLESLASGAIVDEQGLQHVTHLAIVLIASNQYQEALRVCEAALKLVPPQGKHWKSFPMLAFMEGRLKAELGNLMEGLALMIRAMPEQADRSLGATRLWITTYLLRAGLLREADAFDYGEHLAPKTIIIHDHACWLEQPAFLKRACEYAQDPRFAKLGDMLRPQLLGPILLRAIEQQDNKAPAQYQAISGKCIEDYRLYPEIFTCQLWRALGNSKAALKSFQESCNRLAAVPAEINVGLLTRATHHRNALWLARKLASRELPPAAETARQFFHKHVEQGFACFKGVELT